MATNTQSPFDNTTWISTAKNGNTVINVHAQPGAKKTDAVGLYGNKLKFSLASPPVDGKANTMLIKFLSKTLGLPKASIRLISGETSREKRLELIGIKPNELIAAFKTAFPTL